jgi:hypothetical protein
MTLRLITAPTTDSLLMAFDEVAAETISRANLLTCIVPDGAWQHDLKRHAAKRHPFGLDVMTWDQYFEGLWELLGDGRAAATSTQRKKALEMAGEPALGTPDALVRFPRAQGVLTSGIVTELLGFYERHALLPSFLDALERDVLDLTETERAVVYLFERYRDVLDSHALIDPIDRDFACAKRYAGATPILMVAPRELTPSTALVITRLAKTIDITLLFEYDRSHPGRRAAESMLPLFGDVSVEEWEHLDSAMLPAAQALPQSTEDELAVLGARLFRFQPGIEASGYVRVGESIGPLAQPALVSQLIRDALVICEPRDIVLVFKDPSRVESSLYRQFIADGIPFESRYRARLRDTGLGRALLKVYRVFGLDSSSDEGAAGTTTPVVVDEMSDAYELFGLLASPYSGLSRLAAAELHKKWRGQRGSNRTERQSGLAKHAAGAALLAAAERVMASVEGEDWLEANLKLVNLLLTNAASASEDQAVAACEDQAASALAASDDWAAGQAFLNHIRELSVFEGPFQKRDLEGVGVTLERCFDPEQSGNRVRLLASGEPGLLKVAVIILGDLSAAAYPMSVAPGALDELAAKLGFAPPRDLAQRQRSLLLHLVEAAQERFVFYRNTHEAGGDEARQSALFDELLANYRSADEQGPDSKPERIPQALAPFTTRRYEGSTFWQSLALTNDTEHRGFERGHLLNAEHQKALMPAVFSPTSLEAYLRCPYAWFLERRAGMRSIDRGFGALEKGLVAHAVLRDVYGALGARNMARVTPANLPEAQEMLRRSFARVMENGVPGVIVNDRMEWESLSALEKDLLALLERDATLLPAYQPCFFEQPIEGSYAGVAVRGRIDRLDVDANGNAFIIDYKLGGDLSDYGIARKAPRLPFRIQGAIYAAIAERQWGVRVRGILYRSCRKPVTRGVFADSLIDIDDRELRKAQGFAESDALPWRHEENAPRHPKSDCSLAGPESFVLEGFSEYLARVEERVSHALARLAAGDIVPRPSDKGICGYCAVRGRCQASLWDGR